MTATTNTTESPRYRVLLANRGNPDYGQDPMRPIWGHPDDLWVGCESVDDASKKVRVYINDLNLGAGAWVGGQVLDTATGERVGRIAYNGRFLTGEDARLAKDTEASLPLDEPASAMPATYRISDEALAALTQQLLHAPHDAGEDMTLELHRHFKQGIAEMVAMVCGGQVAGTEDDAVLIVHNSSLPDNGGVWAKFAGPRASAGGPSPS